jgi:CheY-like chemotaxis protein
MTTTSADDPPEAVLVVDDDKDTLQAPERGLRRLGYQVLSATNGEAGLALALSARPAVILTDIRMPRIDGHTLLRRLAGHDLDAAVVVMSASGPAPTSGWVRPPCSA